MDLRKIKVIEMKDILDQALVSQIRKRKYVVYGARSIQNQSPYFARNTKDWDLFIQKPKKESNYLQKVLDRVIGFDYFYNKPAQHKGTWKVMNKGTDLIQGNEDDEGIADLSKQPSGLMIRKINGIRFRKLKEEIKAKKSSLKDKKQKFRHEKDRDDLQRIKAYLKIKTIENN